jgi:hypothetical protein
VSSWNSAHASRGAGQEDLKASGGDGLFYCFWRNKEMISISKASGQSLFAFHLQSATNNRMRLMKSK